MSTLTVTTINTANGTTNLTVKTGNSSSVGLTISSSNDNVGVGTSTPTDKLHVSSGDPTVMIENPFSSSNARLKLKNPSKIWQLGLRGSDLSGAFAIRDETSNEDRFVISATGNVGIGNTAPATELQIGGNYGVIKNDLSVGNNHNVNCALGNYFVITCNSSAQNVYFTSTPANTVYSMTLRFANGAGGNTISWANTPKWPGATAPTPSTNNDIWVFITDDGGANWRGNLVQKDSR